ncbi:MAG: hypothetical protein AAGM84_01685 [Pseudomonadota bacterium]
MTALGLDIQTARIDARLIGAQEVAGAVDARLRTLLLERVLPSLKAAADPEDSRVFCLPRLPVHVSLTLAEVLAGQGEEAWIAAFESALSAARADGALWVFDTRMDYLAGYVRARLGLADIPEEVFFGIGPIAHLPEVAALIELLRANPALWDALAEDPARDAPQIVARLRVRAGTAGVTQLAELALASGAAQSEGADARLSDVLVRAAGVLSAELAETLLGSFEAGGLPLAAVHMRLVLRSLLPQTTSADLPALVFLLAAAPGLANVRTTDGLLQALSVVAANAPRSLRGHVTEISRRAFSDEPARRAYMALLAQMHGDAAKPARSTTHRPDHAEATKQRDEPPRANEHAQAARGATREAETPVWRAQSFASPVAGVALCLPFLTENRIGLNFPAEARLQALLDLAGSDNPLHAADPALLALAGQDPVPRPVPERPNRTDLLFVPAEAHAAIHAALPGGQRLARWALARLAATLPGLAGSSPGYLQSQVLQWPGTVHLTEEAVMVEIDRMPLALVVEMSGLLEVGRWHLGWLEDRALTLRLREAAP